MIRAVEMFLTNVIVFIILVTTAQGLAQNCFYYCKLSHHHSVSRPECDCALYNLRKTRSTVKSNLYIQTSSGTKEEEISYDPSKLNLSKELMFNKLTLSFNPNSTQHNNHRKTYNLSESFQVQDKYIHYDNKSYHKNKRTVNNLHKIIEDTEELPLFLFLDIDLHTTENSSSSQIEELKNMFKNITATEKELSECIHFYIYIFSKYMDTVSEQNTNAGRRVEHDNVSRSQELTEIEHKCNPPAAVIKQSIYQIKQSLPQKEPTSELRDDEQKAIYGEEEPYGTRYHESLSTALFTTTTAYPINYVYNDTTETNILTENNLTKKSREGGIFNYNDGLDDVMKTADTSASPILIHEKSINIISTNETNIAPVKNITEWRQYKDLSTTNKTSRTVYEEIILLPKILTKEFSNGTFVSVVDGYENLTNSDFISNASNTLDENIIQYNLNESTSSSQLLKPDILTKNDLKEVQGNLYFSFGNKNVPARFIQQHDGQLNVALDGFSLCDQILLENTSTFMNLLCNCIQFQNCTHTAL